MKIRTATEHFILESLSEKSEELKKELLKLKERLNKTIKKDKRGSGIIFNKSFHFDIEKEQKKLRDQSDKLSHGLNTQALLRKIDQIIRLAQPDILDKINSTIDDYISSIDNRIEEIDSFTSYTEEDFNDPVEGESSIIPEKKYQKEKYLLQVEMLKIQEWVKRENKKIVVIFEGRDAAGKGSTIKRITEYLNPRYFRTVALGIPTEEEKNNWFTRYENHMPKEGEIVFFDRSWYNRAVVEPAMGYCTPEQYESFMSEVNEWEKSLNDKGIILIKLWFSISKDKQLSRFKFRQESPLKYWKFSLNDTKVAERFELMTELKNTMFRKTSTKENPWVIINSNDKKLGRLNAMRYLIDTIPYPDKNTEMSDWYPEVVNVLN
jgi:polyphosphate kinase 2